MKRIGRYLFGKQIWHTASEKKETSNYNYFIYDEDTRIKIDLKKEIEPVGDLMYDSISKKGYAVFHYNFWNDRHWGIIDEDGNIIVRPIYNSIGAFNNGTAIVSKEGARTGVIDSLGHEIIPLKYSFIKRLNGNFEAEADEEFVFFDFRGNVINRQYKCIVRCEENVFGLIRMDTKEYIVKPQYQSIEPVSNYSIFSRERPRTRAYITRKDNKYGLLDSIGKLLNDTCLDILVQREEKQSNDECLYFQEGDRAGYFDRNLEKHYYNRFGEYEIFHNHGPGIRLFENKEILVPPIPYTSIYYLGDDLFLIDKGFKDNRDYICGVIDKYGNGITPFAGKRVVYLGNGLIIYYPRTKDGWEDKPLLYNKEGIILVQAKYNGIGNNYSHIKPEILYGKYIQVYNYTDNHYRWGLIDTSGNELLEPKYEITLFKRINGFILDGHIIVDNNLNRLCALPKRCYSLLEHDFNITEKAILTVYEQEETRFGLFSLPGSFSMLPNATYQYIKFANESRIIVYNKELGYGYTNELGELIIPLRYDEAHPFLEGKAKVRYDTEYGYINREGEFLLNKTILPKEYDWGWQYDDIIIAKKDTSFGCLKKDLSILFPFEFSSREEVQEKVSQFITIGPKNKIAKPYIDSSTGLFGILSENNDVLVPAIFEEILGVQKKDRYHDVNNPINIEFKSELIPVKFNLLWGYIDTDGRTIIPFIYDKASNFSEGLAVVTLIDQKYNVEQGFINQKGEMVIPISITCRIISGFSGGTATIDINPSIPGKDNYEVYVNKRGKFLD